MLKYSVQTVKSRNAQCGTGRIIWSMIYDLMNIFIRQNRQQDRQRTDYIHTEKKYTQQ